VEAWGKFPFESKPNFGHQHHHHYESAHTYIQLEFSVPPKLNTSLYVTGHQLRRIKTNDTFTSFNITWSALQIIHLTTKAKFNVHKVHCTNNCLYSFWNSMFCEGTIIEVNLTKTGKLTTFPSMLSTILSKTITYRSYSLKAATTSLSVNLHLVS
jgi:hypothetical protein